MKLFIILLLISTVFCQSKNHSINVIATSVANKTTNVTENASSVNNTTTVVIRLNSTLVNETNIFETTIEPTKIEDDFTTAENSTVVGRGIDNQYPKCIEVNCYPPHCEWFLTKMNGIDCLLCGCS